MSDEDYEEEKEEKEEKGEKIEKPKKKAPKILYANDSSSGTDDDESNYNSIKAIKINNATKQKNRYYS